jgi:hypothetical protein
MSSAAKTTTSDPGRGPGTFAGAAVQSFALRELDELPREDMAGFVFDDERPLAGILGLLDWRLCGRLSRLLQRKVAEGTPGELLLTSLVPWRPRGRLFLVGLGSAAYVTERAVAAASERLWSALTDARVARAIILLPESRMHAAQLARSLAQCAPPPAGLEITAVTTL